MERKVVDFQLCNESQEPIFSKDMKANIKFDGRRAAIIKRDNEVLLWGRDFINPTNYPEIVESVKEIPGDFILDCEFVVFTDEYKTDRGLLQTRDKVKDRFKVKMLSNLHPASAVVFDCLEFHGQNLRNETYAKRREVLDRNFGTFATKNLKLAVEMDVKEAWELAEAKQLEGIVEKNIYSKYEGKRTDAWIKVKRKELTKIRFTKYEEW